MTKLFMIMIICVGLALPCLAQDVTRFPDGVNTEQNSPRTSNLYNLPMPNPNRVEYFADNFNIQKATTIAFPWLEIRDAAAKNIVNMTPGMLTIKQTEPVTSQAFGIKTVTDIIRISDKSKEFWFTAKWRVRCTTDIHSGHILTASSNIELASNYGIAVGLNANSDTAPLASLENGVMFMTGNASSELRVEQDIGVDGANYGKINASVTDYVLQNRWYETGLWYDGENQSDSLKIYLDGLMVQSASYQTFVATNANLSLVAGFHSAPTGVLMFMDIEDIFVAVER